MECSKKKMENLVPKKKIYILHGWAYTTEKWPPFIKELESIGFQTVFLHIPGLTAPLEKAWNIDDYVSWLSDSLKNEEGGVTLLGHSNGGRISLAYTLKYPDKVKQLILIGSAGVYHNDPMIKFKRAFFGTLAKLGKSFDSLPFIRRAFYRFVGERDYRDASPIMQETMSNLIAVDLVPKLGQIKCPTLLIWGKHDQATPLSDGKIMKEKIVNSELEIINGARHSPHFTHVEETILIIKKYYEKHL